MRRLLFVMMLVACSKKSGAAAGDDRGEVGAGLDGAGAGDGAADVSRARRLHVRVHDAGLRRGVRGAADGGGAAGLRRATKVRGPGLRQRRRRRGAVRVAGLVRLQDVRARTLRVRGRGLHEAVA
jgi:hypothetical protein